jgi:hypothetical protein
VGRFGPEWVLPLAGFGSAVRAVLELIADYVQSQGGEGGVQISNKQKIKPTDLYIPWGGMIWGGGKARGYDVNPTRGVIISMQTWVGALPSTSIQCHQV